MSMKNFPVNQNDLALIHVIAERVCTELPEVFPNQTQVIIALINVHQHVPLDLEAMRDGRLQDVAHDVGGCIGRWDMDKHEFRDCFHPRLAKDQS